jgi:hypothetical protein
MRIGIFGSFTEGNLEYTFAGMEWGLGTVLLCIAFVGLEAYLGGRMLFGRSVSGCSFSARAGVGQENLSPVMTRRMEKVRGTGTIM